MTTPGWTRCGRLDLPAVIIGGTSNIPGLPNLWIDETSAAHKVITYLAGLGHRRIVRVSGPPEMLHTRSRTDAIAAASAAAGIAMSVMPADYPATRAPTPPAAS